MKNEKQSDASFRKANRAAWERQWGSTLVCPNGIPADDGPIDDSDHIEEGPKVADLVAKHANTPLMPNDDLQLGCG